MHFRLFMQITTDITSVTDGQLVAAALSVRDRIVAGERPIVFLNTLYNLASTEMVRRAKQERDLIMILQCDYCRTAVDEDEGRWVFDSFVCGGCMPQLMRAMV